MMESLYHVLGELMSLCEVPFDYGLDYNDISAFFGLRFSAGYLQTQVDKSGNDCDRIV